MEYEEVLSYCRRMNLLQTVPSLISFIFSFFGNGCFIVSTLIKWKEFTKIRHLLNIVAVLNFVSTIFELAFTIKLLFTCDWIYGEFLCKLFHFVPYFCEHGAIGFMVIIACESIIDSVFRNNNDLHSKPRLIILSCFNIVLGFVRPSIMAYNSKVGHNNVYNVCYIDYSRETIDTDNWLEFFMYRLIPLVFVVAIYIFLMRSITKDLKNENNGQECYEELKKRKNTTSILMLVSVFLILTMFSFTIYKLTYVYIPFTYSRSHIFFAIAWVVYTSHLSVIPFFYIIWDDTFRHQITGLLKRNNTSETEALVSADGQLEDNTVTFTTYV